MKATGFRLPASVTERSDQAIEHACGLRGGFTDARGLIFGHEAESVGKRRLVLRLARGAIRDVKEAKVILLGVPSATLDDVRRNGDRGASHLRREPEPLIRGELRRRLVHAHGQLVGQFKRPQLPVVTHDRGVYRRAALRSEA